MRIVRPVSVSTNLLLAMLLTIAVAQLVTGALVYVQSRRNQVDLSAFVWAERISDIVTSLDLLDDSERHQFMKHFLADDDVPLQLDGPPTWISEDEIFSNRFRERVQLLLPKRGQIDIGPATAALGDIDGYFNLLADLPTKGIVRLYDIRIGFEDGTHLMVRLQQVDRELPQPNHWLVYPLVSIAALMFGALLIARTITGPLSRLSNAADAFGRGAAHLPLDVEGPRELRLATHAFNGMQERLRCYIESRTRLLAAMSHDIRAPITRLMLRTATTVEGEDQKLFLRDLHEMRETVHDALETLKNLESKEAMALVDVNALLEALRGDYQELGFSVNIVGEVGRPLLAKPSGLRRLLCNLIDNARKYATSASVCVSEAGSDIIFRITDDGPGIPSDKLDLVLEPYVQLSSSRDPAKGGVGLGLSIARDIAQSHGGKLQLQNALDGGLEAIVALPAG